MTTKTEEAGQETNSPSKLYYTHVNRNIIDSNRKNGTNDPPVRYQKGKYGKPVYGMAVELPAGSRMVYSPHAPILPCGARLVVVSETEPTVVE